ncbi:MAG: DNA polymerase I [Xanthomonadaceae bacterium]|nr:DNA polymerase I [Xanthomonadaceae bacterium]
MSVVTEKPDFVLVDASSYLYRAYHALPPLANSTGQPTGAVYGVVSMLRKLLADHGPKYVGVVFDARGPTFRTEMYAEYKATRPPMPDDLASQVEPLHEIVRAMGLPLLQVSGVEADDVIGTLARRGCSDGMKVLVSTGDKDLAQLVRPGITLINTMSNTLLDEAGVLAKFGVRPDQIIDYLTLVGDTSDNIPGVPGVGPKTAAKWLSQYGTLDALVEDAGQIGGKVGERLRNALDALGLSRKLVEIRCDVSLDVGPADLKPGEPDQAALRTWFEKMEFRTWIDQLPTETTAAAPAPTSTQTDALDYECVFKQADLDRWLKRLSEADVFAFDTETTSIDYWRAEIVGLSFSVEPGKAAYVPLAHVYPGAPAQLGRETVLEKLRPLLEDPAHRKIGQHLKYDANVLANHGIHLAGIEHDTMIESYLLDSTQRHDMDSMAKRVLGVDTIRYEDVAGKGAKQIRFDQVSCDDAAKYAAEDADITLQLHQALWPRLEQIPSLEKLYREVEMPLVPVLAKIEQYGVLIDADMLFRQGHELAESMREVEADAHRVAGAPFNLSSPKQLQEILYEQLGLPVKRKTPKGQPSTAEDVLADLAADYELPALILKYRSLAKLKSTYTDKLPTMISPRTGRVHTSYHQAVAATGRLSSSDPNLQNIPIRTAEGRRIRQAFIAADGKVLLAADYSQIELRIMAHLSGDSGLVAAFAADADVHRATAAEVFDISPDEVSDDQRRSAKAINFGLIYGMSAFGLARQLGISRSAAALYVERYFERYPAVREFMDRTRELARAQGYIETVFGRRLYLPDINARNPNIRNYAERTAINAPMQGTAADIIKRAMIEVDRWLTDERPDCRMIMQVHDELVFEVAADEAESLRPRICQIMEQAATLSVPLRVDAGIGKNWDEAH